MSEMIDDRPSSGDGAFVALTFFLGLASIVFAGIVCDAIANGSIYLDANWTGLISIGGMFVSVATSLLPYAVDFDKRRPKFISKIVYPR